MAQKLNAKLDIKAWNNIQAFELINIVQSFKITMVNHHQNQ